MNAIRVYCLIGILCVSMIAHAQNSKIDSLEKAIKNYVQDDTVKVKMLYE
jgi:hypothetical protein